MSHTKSIIVALLLAGLASFSFAQAAQEAGKVNAAAPVAAAPEGSTAKPKSHKGNPHAKTKHKAKQHAVKAKAHAAKGQSKSRGPGLEAY